MPILTPKKTLEPQASGPPTLTGTKTETIVCTECDSPNEISQAGMIMLRMNMQPKSEPERTCRVCGLPFKRCVVGGM